MMGKERGEGRGKKHVKPGLMNEQEKLEFDAHGSRTTVRMETGKI
jgi:hypothetical protein